MMVPNLEPADLGYLISVMEAELEGNVKSLRDAIDSEDPDIIEDFEDNITISQRIMDWLRDVEVARAAG